MLGSIIFRLFIMRRSSSTHPHCWIITALHLISFIRILGYFFSSLRPGIFSWWYTNVAFGRITSSSRSRKSITPVILKLSWDYYPTNCYDICWAACEQLQRFHTFLKSLRWFESRAKVSRPTIIIKWPGRWLEDLIFETIFFLIGASVLSYRRGVIGRISLRIFFLALQVAYADTV